MATLTIDELLTVEQIAQVLQVSPRIIRNRIKAGLLPARKMVGGKDWHIRRQDAEALFQSGDVPLAEQLSVIDRLSTPEGRARAVAALRSLRDGDIKEQRETLALLQQAEREQPLSFRLQDDSDTLLPGTMKR